MGSSEPIAPGWAPETRGHGGSGSMNEHRLVRWAGGNLVWPTRTGTIIDRIGNTPLYPLKRREPIAAGSEIWAKLEDVNPGGSIKDRTAAMMIIDGIARDELRPGKTIIDSTSGNTGVALALIGKSLGYNVTICMSNGVSQDIKRILATFGAELVFTNEQLGSDGAMLKALEIARSDPERYFMPDQYSNPANPLVHYLTTAPEIWHQTFGRITHLVAPIGTSGTLVGASRRLYEHNPKVQIVAVEPDTASHGLFGMRHLPSTIRPRIYREDAFDHLIRVPTETAYETARHLARFEGLLLGASSAAAIAAARIIARDHRDAMIVAICPDGGSRYLSTRVFEAPELAAPAAALRA
jgi:cysteine synthase B